MRRFPIWESGAFDLLQEVSMAMALEEKYACWYRQYAVDSGKERRIRMKERYGEAEAAFVREVWFPLFGGFDGLIPQAEAIDAEGEKRVLDFAWIYGGLMLNVEIDHAEPLGRSALVQERRRDLHMQAAGWHVVRVAADDVVLRPERCRRMLEVWMNRWVGVGRQMRDPRQDDVLRFAMASGGTVRFRDVVRYLQVSDKTALAVLRGLVDQGVLAAAGGARKRVHKYQVHPYAVRRLYWRQP